jgi:hypothetical protein
MSFLPQLQQALQMAAGGGPCQIDLTHGNHHLTADVANVDSLGCQFQHLTLQTRALAGATQAQLRTVADGLSKKLTYLLEPIRPIEFDAQGCVVQMRSLPPQKGDDGTCYYELLVRAGGQLSLRRWRQTPAGPREGLLATVTREVFTRLADDFASAVEAGV